MTSFKFAALAGVFVSLGCSGTLPAQPDAGPSPDKGPVVKANTEFALDLYRRLAENDGNLFFSPYSISTALAMTYGGARGDTAREMAASLHFDVPPDRLHAAFADLGRDLRGDDKRTFKLHVANCLWGQKDYGFLPEFLTLTDKNYQARLKEVDFINGREEARKEINAWVEGQTNDKIKELVKPGILTSDTRLVLTNAIYFKAAWQHPFQLRTTKPGPFYLATADKKQVPVPMMHGEIRTGFLNADTFQAVQIFYEQRELSMVVFLPRPGSLGAFEKSLTAGMLDEWCKKMSDHMVTITMPKFKVTAEFHLNDQLKRMGMNLAFDPNKADFSGMTAEKKLFISHVVHKAFVDVNEAGTEAAASTAVVEQEKSRPPSVNFSVDHAFLYVIRDNRTGSILFMGRVVDPS